MQLIFNKTSGGGNKVKINGLPPNERLNLKETYNSMIFYSNIFPDKFFRELFTENGISYMSTKSKIYKGNEKGLTQIGAYEQLQDDIYASTKIDNVMYLVTKQGTNLNVYKIENNIVTKTTINAPQNLDIYKIFFIDNILYGISSSEPYKLYKSEDFGKLWTEITGQIECMDGLTLKDFKMGTSEIRFNKNNSIYTIIPYESPTKRYNFNGKVLKKMNIENTDLTYIAKDNINNRDKNKILFLLNKNIDNAYYKQASLIQFIIDQNTITFKTLKEMVIPSYYGFNQCFVDENSESALISLNYFNGARIFGKTYIPE